MPDDPLIVAWHGFHRLLPHRDCAVFVTHVWNAAIGRHFARLKREASPVLDVFLVYQGKHDAVPRGMQPDLVVDIPDAERHFPRRFVEYGDRQWEAPWGYVDLVWCTAFLSPELGAYDRFWLVEYDVDFTGDWREFFAATAEYEADLLACHVRLAEDNPSYYYLPGLRVPEGSAAPMIVFMPISRVSRPLLESYLAAVATPDWVGHFELVLPTVAVTKGLVVSDLGGHGDFTPPERVGLHYSGTFAGLHFQPDSTHAWRPPRNDRYFGDAPRSFAWANQIYHPVKANMKFWARVQFRKRRAIRSIRKRLGAGA